MPSYLTGCSGKLFTVPAIRPAANKFEPFHGCSSHTTAGFEFGLLILPATRAKKMYRAMHREEYLFAYTFPVGCRRNGAISCLPRLGRSANFYPFPLLSRESINLSSHLPSVANEETKVEKEGDEISLEIQRDRAIASDQITSNRDMKIVRNKSV